MSNFLNKTQNNNFSNCISKLCIHGIIILSLIVSLILWWNSERSYLMKGSGESFALYLTAININDWQSLIFQDSAASFERAAHPYWYIHHPNLPAKLISHIFQVFGVSLEYQVAIMLLLSHLGLYILAFALFPIGIWPTVFSIFITTISWTSFHFNAGDLLRAPTYWILWLTIFCLIKGIKQPSYGVNIVLTGCSVLATLSDWGFSAFLISLIYCFSRLTNGINQPKWFSRYIFRPSLVTISLYEVAAMYVVGPRVFIFDFLGSFLIRVANISSLKNLIPTSEIENNNVIIWGNFSNNANAINLLDAFRSIYIEFDILVPLLKYPILLALLYAILRIFTKFKVTYIWWVTLIYSAIFNYYFNFPFQIYFISWIILVLKMKKLYSHNEKDIWGLLTFSILMGLAFAAIIFPGYTINFLYVGGRSPSPILLIISGGLFISTLLATKYKAPV